jgi:YYY domain-containing protein
MTTEPTTTSPQPEPIAPKRRAWLISALLLLAVLAFGAYFRFVGVDWDEGQHLHPDERFLTMVTAAIKPPPDLAAYFDSATSPLNPYNSNFGLFVYGDLPIFITRYTAEVLDAFCANSPATCPVTNNGVPLTFSSYDGVYLLGRALSGLLDLLTLVFIFFIGKRLYGTKVGLLAAALGAATVLQIQQSHFYTADIFATFFVVAAMFFIIRLGDTFWWLDAAAAGIASGLAVASRINVAPLVGILVVAAFVPVFRHWRDPKRSISIEGAVARIVVAGFAALITFRLFMPYAFEGLLSFDPRWSSNMTYIRALVSGEDPGGPPGVQWTARTPFIFPWINIVFWGMGLPLGLAAWTGWAWATWQTVLTPYLKNRQGKLGEWFRNVMQSRHLLVWLWVTGYFVWQGSQWVKSIRYQLPIYPFLALLAAAGLVAFLDWAFRARRFSTLWRVASVATITVVVIGAYGWAWAFTDIYRQPTTRVAASRWIYDNIPAAVTLNVTQDGVERPVQVPYPNLVVLGLDNQPIAAPFEVEQESTLASATIRRLSDLNGDAAPETLRLAISAAPDGSNPIEVADLTANIEQAGLPGESFTLNFDPVRLQPDQTYYAVLTSVSGAPVQAKSSTIAVEAWDETVPVRLDGRDGYSIYTGVEIQRQWEDTPEKLDALVNWLTVSDYVTMSSNRAYGSMPRQPRRYPLTTEYYRRLFTGELGFKLVAAVETYPALGPFTFPDQETSQDLGLWPDPTRCPQAGVPQCRGLINVPLPPAEEAFSVYDHPRVLIFEKTPNFDPEKVRAILSRVDLRDVANDLSPKSDTEAPNGLMLPDQTWQDQQTAGTWSDIFDRNSLLNQAPLLGALIWYATILLLGWLAFPIVFAAAPGLRDRGYGVSRMAGLLFVSFAVWFAASLKVLPFTRGSIVLIVIVLAVIGSVAAWRQRLALRAFVTEHRRTLLVEEALFGAAFLWFLFVRWGNPDLWHPVMGGEKPMDFAYLNAVIKSQFFPPYDPWFAGGQITYYYFGFVLIATLIKLLGIMPSIAYNFAIPALFALTAIGAFSVAFNLVQGAVHWARGRAYWLKNPLVIGVIAAVFVVFMGNLGEAQLLQDKISELSQSTFQSSIRPVEQLVRTAQGLGKMALEDQPLNMRPEWWYFTPTREIPAPPTEAGPISEFPYFTFLYADLHAHMIALPLTLLALALAASWITRLPEWSWGGAVSIGLGGLAVGALRPTNTWDYPTYLLIGAAALIIGLWAQEPLRQTSTWLKLIGRLTGFVLIGFVAFMPFTRSYATAYSSVEAWQGSLTPWWAYLNIHLLFLFPIATFIVWEIKRWGWRWWRALWRTWLKNWHWVVIAGLVIVGAVIFLLYRVNREITLSDGTLERLQRDVALIAGPILVLCVALALRPRLAAAYRFWYFIVFVAAALTLVVEIVVLKGDISRMNTTFKFYLQVWVLLGLGAAVALGWLADRLQNWKGWGGIVWKSALWVLIAASFLYVPLATRGKMLDRWTTAQPPGLNGTDYMFYAEYNDTGFPFALRWDHDAITWLQDNVQGTPVIVEAGSGLLNVPLYHWGSRISINSGLPTIIGWDWHQRQQRSIMPGAVIDRRLQDVAALYQTTDINLAQEILERYGVKYIVVGDTERTYYSPEGVRKFDEMAAEGLLNMAYQNEGTTIYEVVQFINKS